MPPELPASYWLLALLRIALVLVPQLGYIHPDEFFQSIEVQTGNVFGVQSSPPWEFNASFPIRSMAIPYFTIGMVYRLADIANLFLKHYFAFSIITPYFLVVGPRLMMCLLSFLLDATLYKICRNNNEQCKSKLVILASSYVTIVFGTRTFSNTFELILCSLLQYYVCESLIFSNTLIKKRKYLDYRYDTSKTAVERAKFHKLRLLLVSDSFRNCLQISTITVFGFFNRPTFLAYALFPVFFWLYRGLGSKSVAPINFHLRILALLLCSVPSLIFNVVVDSFYYGYITWGEIGVLHISLNNFIFTPLNFVKYNIDSSNLAKHGLHPSFLHALVNMPLLFNVLAVLGFYSVCQAVFNFARGKHHLLPSVRSIKGMMMLSYIAPLLLLSLFPHQEPRFLIPIIIPLVYLHSSAILPEPDNTLVKLEANSENLQTKSTTSTNVFFKLWVTANIILLLFFGFLHQGGVYKATAFLSKDMSIEPRQTEYHIVTSHIYSIPESLFMQRAANTLHRTETTKYALSRRVFLEEKGSSELDELVSATQTILNKIADSKKKRSVRRFKVFVVIPSSLEDKLMYSAMRKNLNVHKLATFYPHISTEAFPDLGPDLFYFYSNFNLGDLSSVGYSLRKMASLFGLNLYSVTQMTQFSDDL